MASFQQYSVDDSVLPLHLYAGRYQRREANDQTPNGSNTTTTATVAGPVANATKHRKKKWGNNGNSNRDEQQENHQGESNHHQQQQHQQQQLLLQPISQRSPSNTKCAAATQNAPTSASSYPSRSTTNQRSKNVSMIVMGFLVIGILMLVNSRLAVHSAEAQLSFRQHNFEHLEENVRRAEQEIQRLKEEFLAMDASSATTTSMQLRGSDPQLQNSEINEMNDLRHHLVEEEAQVEAMKHRVQESSRESVLAEFGEGIHRVEIELVFPDKPTGPTKFVIELAPLDTVPHSIHTFLEMVSHGLLEGCSFIMNAMHVLKATPLPYDGTSATDKAKQFSELGLLSVAFKEYSESFPHKQYTVGFAADGSPSFYINTEDNTAIHYGDPCFGKVVEGFDTIRRLEATPTKNKIWFEYRVGIKKARIIK